MRSDSDIKRDVEDGLRWDPEVDAADIAIAVKNGVVELTGFVKRYGQKWEAARAAKYVANVMGLANDIEVRVPGVDQRPDPDIARDAVAAIKASLPLASEHIRPVVKDGWLTLEGEIEWNFERNQAETVARRQRGIKGVTNAILLKPRAAPAEIKRKIEDAFRRSAAVDASRVTVEAIGGEITLTGTVRSWAERQEAERVAWATPGVTTVEDRIAISL